METVKADRDGVGKWLWVGLQFVLGLIGVITLLLASLTFFIDLWTDNIAHRFALVPAFLGIGLACFVGILLVRLRGKTHVNPVVVLTTLGLWLVGSACFSLGVTAVLLNQEPSQFVSDLSFSFGLCIVPGLFLIGIAGLVYWADSYRHARHQAPN